MFILGWVLVSATLLILSFPNFNQPWCAWIALVPWLWMLRSLNVRQAFGYSWLVGFLFFLGSMWWLVYVTLIGWIVLCAYLALYFGIFGVIVSRLFSCHLSPVTGHLLIPSVWVLLEYARSYLLSGFGLNLLAYSQTSWLPVIQIADVTGAWGVSFLIVMGNVAIVDIFQTIFRGEGRGAGGEGERNRGEGNAKGTIQCLLLTGGLFLVVLCYGVGRLQQIQSMSKEVVRVAVVQGNIPQEEKWDEVYAAQILEKYSALTQEASKSNPALVVWPETAVPAFWETDYKITEHVITLAKNLKIPLLVGSPAVRLSVPQAETTFFEMTNSALLLDDSGNEVARYDKQHLVPFGEFIPFEKTFPWLRTILPPIGDFVPGRQSTVFTIPVRSSESGVRSLSYHSALRTPHSALKFGVLICFEDIFPELARELVRSGAQMLLVITNDAWFGPTGAAIQHTQASTFRAVELRVPVVRAANTGWSGCIDLTGAWDSYVHDDQGRTLFVAGTQTCALALIEGSTFYSRFGDGLAYLCMGVVCAWLIGICRRN